MQTHIATGAQTYRASTAGPAGCRARLAMITTFLQRLPLPLLQLLFRVAIAAVFLKGGLTKIANWMLTVQLFADGWDRAARDAISPRDVCTLPLLSFSEVVGRRVVHGTLGRRA